jgi:hypothetical protein
MPRPEDHEDDEVDLDGIDAGTAEEWEAYADTLEDKIVYAVTLASLITGLPEEFFIMPSKDQWEN